MSVLANHQIRHQATSKMGSQSVHVGMGEHTHFITHENRLQCCKLKLFYLYSRCERGRVVLREGHRGESFYFIYSGSVFVQVDLIDPITGRKTSSVENVIQRGASFGVSIVHN